jgi:hypothetical protein
MFRALGHTRVVIFGVLAIVVLMLASCGVKGPPRPPVERLLASSHQGGAGAAR